MGPMLECSNNAIYRVIKNFIDLIFCLHLYQWLDVGYMLQHYLFSRLVDFVSFYTIFVNKCKYSCNCAPRPCYNTYKKNVINIVNGRMTTNNARRQKDNKNMSKLKK